MPRPTIARLLLRVSLAIILAGCASAPTTPALAPTAPALTPPPSPPPTPTPTPTRTAATFPIDVFAGLGDEPVSEELAIGLQEVLDASANGHGITAAVISPQGIWNGATGLAAGDRQMVPDDQMSIAHITQSLVAAQVMRLVEAGDLSLDDLAADRLPPDLEFDTNGETIADLLSHRSGFSSDSLDGEDLGIDPRHAWTIDELLATVGPERGPVSQTFDYRGIHYVLLGLIVGHVTGQPLADLLRDGVLEGDGYDRLIYQPDERPTNPMAMPAGASQDTFGEIGGYLPSLAFATAYNAEGGMASDSLSLARWFRGLCAGEVVSAVSLDEMTDFAKRPEYGLGLTDERETYGRASGALGHPGSAQSGYTSVALCFQQQGIVVAVLANAEHDVDTVAANLWRAASTPR